MWVIQQYKSAMHSKSWEKENPKENQVLGISRAQKLQQCWKLIKTMQSTVLEVDLVYLIVCILSTPRKVIESTWSAWSMCINLYNSRAQKSIWYVPNNFLLRKHWRKKYKAPHLSESEASIFLIKNDFL